MEYQKSGSGYLKKYYSGLSMVSLESNDEIPESIKENIKNFVFFSIIYKSF